MILTKEQLLMVQRESERNLKSMPKFKELSKDKQEFVLDLMSMKNEIELIDSPSQRRESEKAFNKVLKKYFGIEFF